MTPFQQAWHEKSASKKSRVVAGLDPVSFALAKSEQGLSERSMFSASRGLMFPSGPHATPAEQQAAAKALQTITYPHETV